MDRLEELIAKILGEKLEAITTVVIDELLDELINLVLDTWSKNPEMDYEVLHSQIIEQLKNRARRDQ